jgi:hypothetical protein
MSIQNPITLITPVKESMHDQLFAFLEQLKQELNNHMKVSFEKIGTIHFLRWFVIDYEKSNSNLTSTPKLVFSSNFDGAIDQQIIDLCTKASDVIDKIYSCCEGYPTAIEITLEKRIAYLKKWLVPPSAFYRGSPNRSLQQILNENKLRDFIREYLDSHNFENQTAQQIHKKLKQTIFANAEFEWVKQPITLPKINWIGMVFVGIGLLVLSPVIIIWILIIQFFYERKDVHFNLKRSQLNEAQMLALEKYEDIEMQNQFSQLVEMKPGKIRLLTFKAMMLFAKLLIKLFFVKGKLMGIPSIHYARWVLFDNDKRVLFCSNFDGSWQQYLGDFIDKSGWGLTGIFSNTSNFPKTKFLIMGGAYDEEHFLAWSRNSEVQTQIWYTAYPHLSIKNVNNNSLIHQQLLQNLTEKEAINFLKLI